MKLSENGANEIKKSEGLRLKSYKCSAGVPTIGYGHTKNVQMGQEISKSQADDFFKKDVKIYENEVNRINTTKNYNLNQNQFDSLVSFGYNCGIGNLRKLTNNRTKSQLPDGMKLYNRAGNKINTGLTNRRKRECDLFNKPVGNNSFNNYSNNNTSFIEKANYYTEQLNKKPFIEKTDYYTEQLNNMGVRNNSYISNSSGSSRSSSVYFLPRRGGFEFGFSCSIF